MKGKRIGEKVEGWSCGAGGHDRGRKKVEDYRGITLAQTAHNVYASVLTKRLRVEVKGQRLLPPSQAGFRRGMGCVNNIYVLNHVINRQVTRMERKMVIFFIDLKAAFDSVNRDVLVRAMRKRGVKE